MKSRWLPTFLLVSLVSLAISVTAAAAETEYSYEKTTEALSFEKAFSRAASEGGTVKLTEDIKINTNMTVPEGKSVTIDLNGHIIDRDMDGDQDDDGNLFTLKEYSSLTITDSDPEAAHGGSYPVTGGILTGGGGDDVGGCFHLEDNTTLTMEGGCVYNCSTDDHGGAIRVDGENTMVTLTSVSFYNNRTEDSGDNCHGGAIYNADNCRLTATDCVFMDNNSEDSGGAVYLEDKSYAVFLRCTFKGNACDDHGGAVFQDTDSEAHFEYCTFTGNEAEENGGAIYIDGEEPVKIRDCTFTGNESGKCGSAIYINDEGCYIIDTKITENHAGEYGAVYVDAYHSVDVMGKVIIKDNTDGDDDPSNVYMNTHNYFFGASKIIAAIYDGGLYEGSYIGLSHDGNVKKAVISETISEYQKKYFHGDTDAHQLVWGEDSSQEITELLISSAIGDGYVSTVIEGGIVIVAAGVIIYIITRKRRAASK